MAPVNLLETLDPDSSKVYVRRVMARILGHALADGVGWKELRELWETSGHSPEVWPDYKKMVSSAAGG